eukprot:5967839-Pyramimonas_sp.AAC.1
MLRCPWGPKGPLGSLPDQRIAAHRPWLQVPRGGDFGRVPTCRHVFPGPLPWAAANLTTA